MSFYPGDKGGREGEGGLTRSFLYIDFDILTGYWAGKGIGLERVKWFVLGLLGLGSLAQGPIL